MSDSRIRQLLLERYGVSDPDLIVFDPWSLHGTPEGYEGRRLMQVRVWGLGFRSTGFRKVGFREPLLGAVVMGQ